MRGWLVSSAVLACVAATASAGCGARGAEPVARPRADGPSPADEARRNQYQLFLEDLGQYRGLDPRQRAAATPSSVPEIVPPVPPVLPPVRPRLRGDALVLADLALDRGDPLDAAAQLRAWIAGRDPATTGYAHVRLAEAYLALGQIDRAVAALATATRAPDTEWYALVQLAELRLPTFGPLAVAEQLTLMVPSRADDIDGYLIARASPAAAADLLMRRAERAPTAVASCGFAIAAVARGARRVPVGVPDRCRIEVERAIHVATGEPWLDERNAARRLLESGRVLWMRTIAAAEPEPDVWLAIAERYVHAMEVATTPDDTDLASRSAATALVNALRQAFLGSAMSDEARLRFDAVADVLAPSERKLLSAVLRAQPPPAPGSR